MPYRILCLFLLLFSGVFLQTSIAVTPSDFTIVIDPGHGGKDSGTKGASSKEKDIVLAVGLKLGQLIRQRQPEVHVIYTRATDVFIPLDQRARIANKAKANLFLSIHADHAESPTVKGVSTFTLGQNRTRENMEIAKRENSVILLENDYKQRYEGFDPNSAESYIMFEFMQDNYMNQSIQFASTLQNTFAANGRLNRGVRQDVFLVLRCTSMPSVLVELGFLSNQEEEEFLKSEEGQEKMAASLYKSFIDFKSNYERKSTSTTSLNVKPSANQTTAGKEDTSIAPKSTTRTTTVVRELVGKTPGKNDSADKAIYPRQSPVIIAKSDHAKSTDETAQAEETGITFKVQVIASDVKLAANDKKLKSFDLDFYYENKLYKYTIGSFSTFEEANRKRREVASSFTGAFVIAFKNGQKITVDSAKALLKNKK